MNIPFEWFQEPPKYFITYYGEIFFGRVVKVNEDGSFYILTNNKTQDFQNSKDDEKYRELCDLIPSKNVIRDVKLNLFFSSTEPPKSISTSGERLKKMFVFGAGASRYCIFDDEKETFEDFLWKPPLGFEVFHKNYASILDKYKEVKTFIPYFLANHKDIEEALEKEWQDIINCYNPSLLLRHIQIQFYLRELLMRVSHETIENFNNNLYALLIDYFNRYLCRNNEERIICISFNYDTILDYYIEKIFDYKFNTLSDYIDIQNKKILLIKPHGSWDWGWRTNQVNLYEHITTHKLDLSDIYFNLINKVYYNSWGYEAQFNEKGIGRYKADRNAIEKISDDNSKSSFPAILMPYKNKDEIMMTYTMFDTSRFLSDHIEELYLIGWKGNEKIFNEHVLKRLNRLNKIIIVNPEPNEVIRNIESCVNLKHLEILKFNSFEEFVINLFHE
ncbi:MAG: hypothetical protein N3F09_10920 [Bacteroidia bacterium]|nr:hypothetical protein [Bacteroidia bacterium]